MKFVKINGKILDYDIYIREALLIKNHLIISLHDVFKEHGFTGRKNCFVNKDLNLQVKIKFERISLEEFV